MTLEGDNILSVNERIVLFLTGVVSFISIMCTVWYAAMSVNDLTHAVSDANKNITTIQTTIEDYNTKNQILQEQVGKNTDFITDLKENGVTAIYINDDHGVFQSNGYRYKMAIYDKEMANNGEG